MRWYEDEREGASHSADHLPVLEPTDSCWTDKEYIFDLENSKALMEMIKILKFLVSQEICKFHKESLI